MTKKQDDSIKMYQGPKNRVPENQWEADKTE